MVKKILCSSRYGLDSKVVQIEATFSKGLPSFIITGLASSAIQESKQRVISVLAFNNFQLPNLKITINLSPSDLPKSGSYFDLPIALLVALQKQSVNLSNWFAFGELGLDGVIKSTPSIYPLVLDLAQRHPDVNILLPKDDNILYRSIPNINVYFVSNFIEAIDAIKNPIRTPIKHDLNFKFIEIDSDKYYYDDNFKEDFCDVKGQVIAKRAALIAVSGMHNIIFEGSPGCGKSMIVKRMRHILPPISFVEMCECSKIRALSNMDINYSPIRPYRNPHQSSSKASILGSVMYNEVKPGELALSHNGLLFFDELLNFNKHILESLREPLENNELSVSRVGVKFTYPTSFLFAGATNPCPCGNLYSAHKECRCSDIEIDRYQSKLTQPFKDRIDLFVKMEETKSSDIITSNSMFRSIINAFIMQKQRKQNKFNGKLSDSDVDKFCILDNDARDVFYTAIDKLSISYRGIKRLMKVSRSIADLDSSELIKPYHILEALSFRKI